MTFKRINYFCYEIQTKKIGSDQVLVEWMNDHVDHEYCHVPQESLGYVKFSYI